MCATSNQSWTLEIESERDDVKGWWSIEREKVARGGGDAYTGKRERGAVSHVIISSSRLLTIPSVSAWGLGAPLLLLSAQSDLADSTISPLDFVVY